MSSVFQTTGEFCKHRAHRARLINRELNTHSLMVTSIIWSGLACNDGIECDQVRAGDVIQKKEDKQEDEC
jgi:hypothetical protein